MDWGFQGLKGRALELPAADPLAVGLAPEGRARFIFDPDAGEVLVSVSDGSYAAVSGGGGTPGGANTDVQFNDGGAFGGNTDFTYDGTNARFGNVVLLGAGADTAIAANLPIGASAATSISLGNATTNPPVALVGTGDLQVPSHVRLAEVGDPGAVANFGFVYAQDVGGGTEMFWLDAAGNAVQMTVAGEVSPNLNFDIPDNAATAYLIEDSSGFDLFRITTLNGNESINMGNTGASSPIFNVFGNGVALSGGTDLFFQSADGSTAGLSAAATGRLRYNNAAAQWEASVQGGAYAALGGASPGGADTQVQYNNAGAFDGDGNFTFDGTNVTLAEPLFADGGVDLSGGGTLNVGSTNATTVHLGSTLTQIDLEMLDNSFQGLRVRQGATDYIKTDTVNANELLQLGDGNLVNIRNLVRSGPNAFLIETSGGNDWMRCNVSGNIMSFGNSVDDQAIDFLTNGDISMALAGTVFIGGDCELGQVAGDAIAIQGMIGFYGTTPVIQSDAYTVTNPVDRRAFDTTTVTLSELAEAVGTIIADLTTNGMFQ